MKRAKKILMLGLMSVITSCSDVQTESVSGNGNTKEEVRTVSDFSVVSVSGNFAVDIKGGSTPSLKVTADENLMPYIITEVNNNRLEIRTKDKARLQARENPKINIISDNIISFDASGAVTLSAKDLKTESFSFEASGSSKAELAGSIKKLNIANSGSTIINARKLKTLTTVINSSGISDIQVNTTQEFHADISGAGKILYYGEPEITDIDKSGAIEVTRK